MPPYLKSIQSSGVNLYLYKQKLTTNVYRKRDRLVIPDINKKYVIQGAGWLSQNDITWGQALYGHKLTSNVYRKRDKLVMLDVYKEMTSSWRLASTTKMTSLGTS